MTGQHFDNKTKPIATLMEFRIFACYNQASQKTE